MGGQNSVGDTKYLVVHPYNIMEGFSAGGAQNPAYIIYGWANQFSVIMYMLYHEVRSLRDLHTGGRRSEAV